MSEPRTLAVQSVLYENTSQDIVRAGLALANSVDWARRDGFVSDWTYNIGDCSPEAVFDEVSLAPIVTAVEAAGGSVSYTIFGKNLGSAAGHNALAATSQSDLMLILNPDAQVAPDTIGVLSNKVFGAVGIAESRQVPLEHPKDFAQYDGDTSWASTACAMTARAAFDKVSGFDSDTFFLYCDDVDYSWRLRLAGYRVVFEPAAAVFHDKRLTVSGDWPASAAEIYYSAEAAILLAYKYSRGDLVKSILARYREDGSAPLLKAVAEFETRSGEGQLPSQLDPGHQVGQFVKDNYATHRF
jgi:GT2 family glycosyltransferase